MKHSTLIQLVEDDPNLGSLIEENLREEGYGVNWLKNGEEALSKFDVEKPQLLILDVMLPDIDGFELATRFRAKDKQTPILFLTAKDLTEDRIKGFESGGDDYITKPFSMKELLLRMEVFLRRSGIQEKEKSDVVGGSWALDSDRRVFAINASEHKLTNREFELLQFLLERQDELIPRENILKELWGDDDYFMGRSLDVFISRLRNMMKAHSEFQIENEHGIGFRLKKIDS